MRRSFLPTFNFIFVSLRRSWVVRIGLVPLAILGDYLLHFVKHGVALKHSGELHPRVRRGNFQSDDLRSVTKPILELVAETFQSSLPGRSLGADLANLPVPDTRCPSPVQ